MKKIIIACSLIANLFAAETTSTEKSYSSIDEIGTEDRTALKAPLQDIFSTTAWKIFLKEFEIGMKVGICGEKLTDKAFGFRTSMVEPFGYIETSIKPLYFPFAKLDLGGNILKTTPARANDVDEAGRTASYYTHFIYAPLLGMILKKFPKFLCISGGSLVIPVISEFDPTTNNDLLSSKVFIQMAAMVSPQAIVSSILDCGATASYSAIKGYSTGSLGDNTKSWDSVSWQESYEDPKEREEKFASANELKTKGLEKLAFIRNSMYFNVGCLGYFNIADAVDGGDPIADANMLAYAVSSKLHGASTISQVPLLQKFTEFPGYPSTLCKPIDYPLSGIKSQTVMNLAFPTTDGGKELGEVALNLSTFKNLLQGKDSTVYVFWQRRDILAGAYYCKNKMDNGGGK